MDKIFCEKCNTSSGMEVHESIDNIVYCTCTNCGTEKKVKEFQEEDIDGKNYLYSPLLNAYYRRCPLIGRYFLKLDFTKKGVLKSKATTVGYQDRESKYLDEKIGA